MTGVLISWSIFPKAQKVSSIFLIIFQAQREEIFSIILYLYYISVYVCYIPHMIWKVWWFSLVWVWSCHIIHKWRNHRGFMHILPNRTRIEPLYKNTSLGIKEMWIIYKKASFKIFKKVLQCSAGLFFPSVKVIFKLCTSEEVC